MARWPDSLNRWLEGYAFRLGDAQSRLVAVRLRDTTERKRREANGIFLAQVTDEFTRRLSAQEIMQTVGAKIGQYLNLASVNFLDIDETQEKELTVSYFWGKPGVPILLGQYYIRDFLTQEFERACRAGETYVINDTQTDPRTDAAAYASLAIGAYVNIPFHYQGRWSNILAITDTQTRVWRADELELFDELANRIFPWLQRARAQEALHQADRQKDEFMAMLGHELRNPLAVLTNTLMYLEMTKGQDQSLSYPIGISRMNRQVQHLGRMVDDLLDVSRIRQGKIKLQRQRIDLAQLVEQTLEAARPLFKERNRSLEGSLPSEPVFVNGDATRLAQVVMNLLTNGVKYTHEGGHVWVSLKPAGNQVILRVEDDGMGIPTDELRAIFEPFVQGNTSLDRPQGGLGLGLAVVKQLVEGHEGRIEVHSAGLEQGSQFVVALPLLTEKPVLSQPETNQTKTANEAMRVLLVDDNQELVELTAKIMQMMGYQVHSCYSGQEGIKAAETWQPDVLLLDIGLPHLDGYAVCRHIRQQPWGHSLPIIALTGYGQEADKQRSRAAGFDGHLLKPIDYTTLPAFIAQTIAAKKGADN